MTFKQDLQSFINNTLINDADAVGIGEDESLIQRGVLDSMGVMRLISFIEERAKTRVPDEEVKRDNFDTVTKINQLVESLKAE